MFFRRYSSKNNRTKLLVPTGFDQLLEKIKAFTAPSKDWSVTRTSEGYSLFYYDYLIDSEELQHSIMQQLQGIAGNYHAAEDLLSIIPLTEIKLTEDFHLVMDHLLKGWVFIHLEGLSKGLLCNISKPEQRSLSKPEIESQIYGPQVAFVESLSTNLAIIRNYVPNSKLINEEFEVGKQTLTSISILYIKDIANPKNIQEVKRRLEQLDIDYFLDSSMLSQLISDQESSLFPEMLLTERPDRTVYGLMDGKIAILVAGSPTAILCPCNLIDFFKSTEDLYVRWNAGTFLRVLRITAVIISVLLTPSYVAALTFHYQLIPSTMLVSLAQSRSRVPFPPLMEAFILEFMIELLREAGARLPTKVGQTMSIVGGIVIGQAAVQAGFTSNILIIIVALGALASFTTPSYMIGNAIRILRFPMILLAGILGGVGIMVGFCFTLIHLLRLTSLGNSYLLPLYPPVLRELPKSIIRAPFRLLFRRPTLPSNNNQVSSTQRSQPQKTPDIFEEPVGGPHESA
ncbi:spore germination protein [Brevibacillus choshinensis]|uniref:spore germination protein n=1 Tax=Brevibacillus choshinensis TaxID=54911 RepID=UPI002E1B9048|nr:spore germination protein [Brevibacillus choshinensis]MED4749788.1 spore germination protein [Brevibacillus choshinensis]MED4779939.1 spore germination protein [Brevibacillus choshinensis]